MAPPLTLAAILAVAALMRPSPVLAVGSGLGVDGSAHDFTDNRGAPENDDLDAIAWNNERKEICRVCHVPHDHAAVRYGNQGILWNHQTTTRTDWQMYGSDPGMIGWIDGAIEPAPTGVSKLCLGCHDGVTAINQYDGRLPTDPGYGGGTVFTMGDYDASYIIGGSSAGLTNNHPISVRYDVGMDSGLRDPATAVMDNGISVASLLDDGRVECSTCHDVHDEEAVAGTALLRQANKGADLTGDGASARCLLCHDK